MVWYKDLQWSNICKEAHLKHIKCISEKERASFSSKYAYFVDCRNHGIHHFTLVWLEYNGLILHFELCQSCSRQHFAFADVQERHYCNDVSKPTRACSFHVSVQLILELCMHIRPKKGWMKRDSMRELFLQKRNNIDESWWTRESKWVRESHTKKNMLVYVVDGV